MLTLTRRNTDLAAALDRIVAASDPEDEIRRTVRSLVRLDNQTGQQAAILVAKLLAKRLHGEVSARMKRLAEENANACRAIHCKTCG